MFLTVIIPTFNRSEQLNKTLFNLVNHLFFDKKICEIIIIDNGSNDHTKEIVKQYQVKYSELIIRYFYDDIPGLLTGRHRGVLESKGEILTFIDDDVCVSSTWLYGIIDAFKKRQDISFVTGPNLPLFESYPPEWLNYFWDIAYNGKYCSWLSLMDFGNNAFEINPNFVWGLNFSIRKNDFYKLGGFHPDNIHPDFQHFQGDGETGLTMKAEKYGLKALYNPAVLLYHQIPSSRLTYDYFKKRAFYSGVCNSFSEIKFKLGFYSEGGARNFSYKQPILTKINSFIKENKINLVKRIQKANFKIKPATPYEVLNLKKSLRIEEIKGYEFHQNNYYKNPLVKSWVEKENYLDYILPK
jgi:glycosyltransferase involved in cell wall biosynthesis